MVGGLGPLGLVLVFVAFQMQGWAERHGVHCPHCGRPANLDWWLRYFEVRNGLFLTAFLGGVLALIASRGALRALGALAMVVAFLGFGFMPM
jgi:hypothetical protein